jgi:TPR repeat protein
MVPSLIPEVPKKVSVTPTSSALEELRTKVAALLYVIAATFCFAVVFCYPAVAADDVNEDHSFFSYLPAPPELHLPKLDFAPFWTSDLKIGRKAYRNGDYDRALKYFRKASDEGNATAEWYLGHMYRLGRGVVMDQGVAYSYYSRVAEAYANEDNDSKRMRIAVDCQLHMADYLRVGVTSAGIPPAPEQAARIYLRLASNYGHPAAMYALGVMNIEGQGVQKNPQQGLKWIMASARKRNARAQAYLGQLYERGDIVLPDETRSLMWYVLAAETATAEDEGDIRATAKIKYAAASDDIKLEADARARVFSDQFPPMVRPQE